MTYEKIFDENSTILLIYFFWGYQEKTYNGTALLYQEKWIH